MTYVAATNIDDGDNVIAAGQPVKKGTFDDETMKHLEEIGSVYQPDQVESLEPDERDQKIAELEAQLRKLTGQVPPPGIGGPEQPVANAEGSDVAKDSPVDLEDPSTPVNPGGPGPTTARGATTPAAKTAASPKASDK